jgi:hypothetical protein
MSDKEKSSHEVGVVAREQTLLVALHGPDPALYRDIERINSRELNMPSVVRAYQDVIALGRANPSNVSPQVLAKGVFEALDAAKAAIENADAPLRQKGTWDSLPRRILSHYLTVHNHCTHTITCNDPCPHTQKRSARSVLSAAVAPTGSSSLSTVQRSMWRTSLARSRQRHARAITGECYHSSR